MGRVRRDSLAAAEEIIDDKAVSIDSKDSSSKFKDSSFVNSNVCTKCKREESVDGRWIQCDKCSKWYHTACVKIQLDNNGKFSGDYYCRECRRSAKQAAKQEASPTDRDCKASRRLSVSSASSSRSSGSTHKKLKSSNGSASRITPPPSEPSTLSGNHNGVAPMEVEEDQETPNCHDNLNNSNTNVSELPRKQTCKPPKNGFPQKPNNNSIIDHPVTVSNGNGSCRKEKKTSFASTINDVASESPILFHPYNWPHPVSYNRALHRVAQIREFILTHCPAAAASPPLSASSVGGIGIDGIGINMMEGIVENTSLPETSIKIAVNLWNKLERLEKSHNRKHLSLSNNINSQ